MIHLEAAAAEGPDDPLLDAARELIAAAEAADGGPPVSDQAVLGAAQGRRALLVLTEAPADREAAADPAPGPAAVGIVGEGEVDLVVDPARRGRGVGAAALRLLLARADGELRAWAHGENPAAESLLRSAGFAPVRSLFRMALDPGLLPDPEPGPLAVAFPEGLRLRAFDPGRPGDAEAWVRVNAAAFAAHPEQGRITLEDFALLRRESWFDPRDLLLLADVAAEASGDRLAGSTWIKTLRSGGAVECELYAVGVHPDYAGRGLGRLLLRVTLARMAEHAPERVTLYVDGENTRAVRLYEAAGFTIDSRSRQWKRPADPAP